MGNLFGSFQKHLEVIYGAIRQYPCDTLISNSVINKHMHRIHKQDQQRGFTIVELLIVIIVIGILAALTLVAFNGLSARADKASMVSDLNNVHKLVENYRAVNGSLPTSLSQLSEGSGYTASKDSSVQISSTGGTNPSYCITVTRKDQYMNFNSTSGATSDSYCTGHGPVAPAQVVYASNMTSYPTANTTYPITPGVALQAGDVVISFHSEHYIVGTAYLKADGVSQTAVMSQSLGAGSKVYRVSILTNVTSSTALSFTTDGSSVEMGYYVVRGLTNPTAYTSQTAGWSGSSVAGGSSITVPSQSLKAGQVAIMGSNTTSSSITFPYNPTPALSSWTVDSTVLGLIRTGYVIGTKDIPSISAGVYTSGANYLGAAIFILG